MYYPEEINKRPKEYAPYLGTLDEDDLKVAKEELHEDVDTREPSIAQMREFIAKHPQIIRCRTDPVFILRFLRYKKFNVTEACAMLERTVDFYMPMRLLYEKEIETFYQKVLGMQELGVMLPLGYDPKKRMVILNCMGAFPKTTSALMQMGLGTVLINTCMEYERMQVYGLVWIADMSEVTMAHMGMWGLAEMKMLVDTVDKHMTIKVKEIHMIKVPKFAWMLLEFVLPLLSPKLRNRFKFHRTLDDLRSSVDPSILPSEYGGQSSLEKAKDNFRNMFQQQRKWVKLEAQLLIDRSIPVPGQRNEESMVGSFRKLNVD